MGYRKTIKAGPFRFTASKSGLSTSLGGRAGRVNVNSKGRRTSTVRVPGTGLSWRKSKAKNRD